MKLTNKSYKVIWFISMLALFFFFIRYWESRSIKNIQNQLNEQSIIIRDALWIVDPNAPVQYLKLAALHSSYERIIINLNSMKEANSEPFLIVDGPDLNFFEHILVSTGLIPRRYFDVPVYHKEKKIGSFSVIQLNKNFYIYFNAFIIIFLCSMVFIYFIKTIEAKSLLEQRVSLRTRELRESEKMYRTLVGNIPGVSFRSIHDGQRTMKLISDEIERISGYPGTDFINNTVRSYSSIILSEDLNRYKNQISRAVQNKEAYSIQYRINSQFDSLHWVFEKGQGIFDANGEIIYIDGVIIDITEQKQIEKEKAELLEQLNHKNRMDAIGHLASGMAHDFNNILSGIMNAAQLLQMPKYKLDAKALEYVEMIITSSIRASDLISKLMIYGRKSQMMTTTIDMDKIVKDTIEVLSRTINKKIQISYNATAGNCLINGDNSSIHSALLNLGINASHAMPHGGNLEFSTKNMILSETFCNVSSFEISPGEYIEVEIRDSGSGIPLENLKKIFEPFYTTKDQGEGTGLGLYGVYGTVIDHHGAIEVYSEIGTGTVFKIQLPCNVEGRKPLILENQIIQGTGKILLVDDEEVIRLTCKSILEEMGYQVVTAENGEEAIRIFRANFSEIDLVLMDMIMPVMDGREAFSAIREIDKNAKIIIASGFSKDGHLEEMKEAGLNGFIRKPFNSFELSQLVSEIIKG